MFSPQIIKAKFTPFADSKEKCCQGLLGSRADHKAWVIIVHGHYRVLRSIHWVQAGLNVTCCSLSEQSSFRRKLVEILWFLHLSFPLFWNIGVHNLGALLIYLLAPLKSFNLFERSRVGWFKLHSPNSYSSYEDEQSQGFSTIIFSSFQLLIRVFQLSDVYFFWSYICALYDFFRQRYW